MMMSTNNSTATLDVSPKKVKRNQNRQHFLVFGIFLCAIGISSLIATTVILNNEISTGDQNRQRPVVDKDRVQVLSECSHNEKEHFKLHHLYQTIKDTFYEFSPTIKLKNGDTDESSSPFNFTPEVYKHKTRTAQSLLKNLRKYEESSLARDASDEVRHTLELFKYFLSNTFGDPYENNYEAGDWLMGPNIFCWQRSCQLIYEIGAALGDFVPRNEEDVVKMIELMKKYREVFQQKIRNLRYGVAVGIVPPEEACRVGLNYFKLLHINVAKNGEKGIFKEAVAIRIRNSSFLEKIPKEEKRKWREKYNVSIHKALSVSILNNLGKPLHDLMRYLEDDYITHCPPSNVSSGYASLPLPYVYTNGFPDVTRPTNGSLPGAGERFNASLAYKIMLSYFTTYDVTPKEIDELANQRLKELYSQVVKIAKELTKAKDDKTAVKQFKVMLANKKFFYMFGNHSLESTPQHLLMCNNAETAKKYCPGRWRAMNNWVKSARAMLSELRTKLSSALYLRGNKSSFPLCPVDFDFDYNPASAYYSYTEGNNDCSSLAKVNIPFFLDKLGPKYEEMTVLAHEAYPGHHLEVQGVNEHFQFKCEPMGNWVSKRNYFAAFSEGWATYAEKHVADADMKIYKDDLISKYGMLKHQILAALRAKVDVGLHYIGMKRHAAITLYEKYVWDSGDVITKEITRLQSAPGQGTSYMVGENRLWELRKKAAQQLREKFHVRDFHFKVLGKGPLPLDYLSKNIEDYIKRNISS